MIHLTNENFSKIIQEIMENFYLQPLDGSKKLNVKDGYIERSIHGAMHASRATLWVLIMQNFLEQKFPEYTNLALQKISKFLNTDPEKVKLLILIAMACHDAGRKGEGKDLWEKESGEIAAQILKEIGLDENQIKLLSKAIQFKDQKAEYQKELTQLGISEEDLNHFDYIRKIINLGDNLDLIRCVGSFNIDYIFKTLNEIDDFKAGDHTELINNLVKEIQSFIHHQFDLRFDNEIRDQNKQRISELRSHLAHKEKVKYEHADNVFATMFSEASNTLLFKSYLSSSKILLPTPKKYDGPCKFDPFIHGTNSSIFAGLSNCEFEILSPLEMIKKYQTASMTGEVTQGGYRCVSELDAKQEMVGKTSFTKIRPFNKDSYSLDKVLRNYTAHSPSTSSKSFIDFKQALSSAINTAYSNINLVLIYFARARQTHTSLEEVISNNELNEFRENFNATIQFYYFIQLFGTHIFPDLEKIKKSGIKYEIQDGLKYCLTFENIIQKIQEYKINMQEVLQNPTKENLGKALKVLELPNNWDSTASETTQCSETQFFCLEKNGPDSKYQQYPPIETFYEMSKNDKSWAKIGYLLKDYASEYLDNNFFKVFSESAKKQIVALNDRMGLFTKILNAPQHKLSLSELQNYFLENAFPIILLSENENKITLFNNSEQEYRSLEPLKFSQDINMIATDNDNHRLEIMKFLDLHRLSGIQVVLFDDLKLSKISKEKPSEPYHHDDGIPTLKWLAAKKVSVQPNSIFKAVPDQHSKIFTEKNIKAANDLIEDAKKYNNIEFRIKR